MQGKCDLYPQAIRLKARLDVPSQPVGDLSLQKRQTEAAAHGLLDDRPVLFVPAQRKIIAIDGPIDRDGARRLGQRAVFGRVGGQLVNGHAQRKTLLRAELRLSSLQAEPFDAEWFE